MLVNLIMKERGVCVCVSETEELIVMLTIGSPNDCEFPGSCEKS